MVVTRYSHSSRPGLRLSNSIRRTRIVIGNVAAAQFALRLKGVSFERSARTCSPRPARTTSAKNKPSGGKDTLPWSSRPNNEKPTANANAAAGWTRPHPASRAWRNARLARATQPKSQGHSGVLVAGKAVNARRPKKPSEVMRADIAPLAFPGLMGRLASSSRKI